MVTSCQVLLQLLLLVTLLHESVAENFADLTISSRMAQLINSGVESPKLQLNTTLPVEVQYLLSQKGLVWKELGGTMQRLMLWDQGYVVTNNNTTREIKVRCNLGMDDVVVLRDEFVRLHNCLPTVCVDPVGSGTLWRGTVCAGNQIKQVAKCAVLVSESEATGSSVDVETRLVWSEEGYNTDVPMPRLCRHSLDTFAITMQTPTGDGTCPHQLALVIPCTTVQSSANSSEWCKPHKSGVLAGLLQDLADLRQTEEMTDTGSTGIIIAICVVASAVAMVLYGLGLVCVRHILFVRKQRKQWSARVDLIEKSGLEGCAFTPEGAFFVNANYGNDAIGPMSLELFDFEAKLGLEVRKRHSNASGHSEVNYSDALGTSGVLFRFQNDPVVLALRVPIIDVNGDKLIFRGIYGSPNELLVGSLDSRAVVLKRLQLSKRNDISAVERLAREICVAARLEHPNIVNIVGIAWDSFQNLVAIWEYHRSGDLRRALQSEKKARDWTWTQQKLQIAVGILRGLSFLHAQSPPIIHGAIEPRHILLDSATGGPALCGFGCCAGRASSANCEDSSTGSQADAGSIWSSPEVLTDGDFSEKSDVYSFGVMLVALDTGKVLEDVSSDGLLKLLTPLCPGFIREIAHGCLQSDPVERPMVQVLLRYLEEGSNSSSVTKKP
ncbi:unnamed protein product [Peronospora farinosa]|uniref:Protein kinase domain-containing protein n=1 Tax=Peronospora farinosa TaxID=134698 RepID=A0AAV0UAJ0_9STRA|nr:unnamed protein product [Peronospora farinosa]CAI5733811.1 unnamed protein product [Peronospora farinosa]